MHGRPTAVQLRLTLVSWGAQSDINHARISGCVLGSYLCYRNFNNICCTTYNGVVHVLCRVCAVYVSCMCRVCAVCVCRVCAVYVPRMCRVCAVYVPCMCRVCAVCVCRVCAVCLPCSVKNRNLESDRFITILGSNMRLRRKSYVCVRGSGLIKLALRVCQAAHPLGGSNTNLFLFKTK